MSPLRSGLIALLGVLILSWPALVNRQPFFFSDTSSYVRAGDMVAHIVAGDLADTIWTREDMAPPSAAPAGPAPDIGAPVRVAGPARGNDPASGYIMAGRSPYFGAALWATWVAGRFWPFVLGQAAIAYVLVVMALRCFGVDRTGVRLVVCAALALATPLAVYDGVVLADALSGFGIVAFLLLLAPEPLRRREAVFLVAVLLASVVSHLTHLVMLAAMAGLLLLLVLARRVTWRQARMPLAVALGVLVAGALSVTATSLAVRTHFGRSPVLVPLMTARFVADGPGRDYIEAGCDGRRFAVCTIPYRAWTSSTDFLWSRDAARGAFLLADTPTRLAMSEQDKAFAVAVARREPLRVAGLAVWNSLLQVADLRVDIVDERCLADPGCFGTQFPAEITSTMARTPAGHGRWPLSTMNAVVYAAAAVSLAVLAVAVPRLVAGAAPAGRLLSLWLLLAGVAMAANAFLGGAISEPQSRYQTRMWWVVPLMAAIAWLASRRLDRRTPR